MTKDLYHITITYLKDILEQKSDGNLREFISTNPSEIEKKLLELALRGSEWIQYEESDIYKNLNHLFDYDGYIDQLQEEVNDAIQNSLCNIMIHSFKFETIFIDKMKKFKYYEHRNSEVGENEKYNHTFDNILKELVKINSAVKKLKTLDLNNISEEDIESLKSICVTDYKIIIPENFDTDEKTDTDNFKLYRNRVMYKEEIIAKSRDEVIDKAFYLLYKSLLNCIYISKQNFLIFIYQVISFRHLYKNKVQLNKNHNEKMKFEFNLKRYLLNNLIRLEIMKNIEILKKYIFIPFGEFINDKQYLSKIWKVILAVVEFKNENASTKEKMNNKEKKRLLISLKSKFENDTRSLFNNIIKSMNEKYKSRLEDLNDYLIAYNYYDSKTINNYSIELYKRIDEINSIDLIDDMIVESVKPIDMSIKGKTIDQKIAPLLYVISYNTVLRPHQYNNKKKCLDDMEKIMNFNEKIIEFFNQKSNGFGFTKFKLDVLNLYDNCFNTKNVDNYYVILSDSLIDFFKLVKVKSYDPLITLIKELQYKDSEYSEKSLIGVNKKEEVVYTLYKNETKCINFYIDINNNHLIHGLLIENKILYSHDDKPKKGISLFLYYNKKLYEYQLRLKDDELELITNNNNLEPLDIFVNIFHYQSSNPECFKNELDQFDCERYTIDIHPSTDEFIEEYRKYRNDEMQYHHTKSPHFRQPHYRRIHKNTPKERSVFVKGSIIRGNKFHKFVVEK